MPAACTVAEDVDKCVAAPSYKEYHTDGMEKACGQPKEAIDLLGFFCCVMGKHSFWPKV
ncbi:hypothetical protein E2542_SST19656 [Spatholobus suberectus]|nr:hypothetical protein E2542_SST19656 [Spatholobus suberectus]